MGHERWYISLPKECDLLDRSLEDEEFGAELGQPWIFERGGYDDWSAINPVHREFCDAVRQMNVDHPGISDRVFSLDRAYDAVHYLLSDNRRQCTLYYGDDDWGTKAILGVESLPPHIDGGQAIRSAYTSPEDVKPIADWLRDITMESLRPFYDPEDMDLTVYKFDGQWVGTWDWISHYFNGIKAFYLDVAQHGDAILMVVS